MADEVLKLTHALVHYGSMSHPVKRRVRDIVVPALGRSTRIQGRAARRLSQVFVPYPPGPLARPGRGRGTPKAGQRMPDIAVRAGGHATTLHAVLRSGRHVLVLPVAGAADVLSDPRLRPYWQDVDVATAGPGQAPRLRNDGTGLVVLVRPDGHMAAQARPGSLQPVAGYLHDLFGEPAGEHVGDHSAAVATGR